jgi:hypothetical protein
MFDLIIDGNLEYYEVYFEPNLIIIAGIIEFIKVLFLIFKIIINKNINYKLSIQKLTIGMSQ